MTNEKNETYKKNYDRDPRCSNGENNKFIEDKKREKSLPIRLQNKFPRDCLSLLICKTKGEYHKYLLSELAKRIAKEKASSPTPKRLQNQMYQPLEDCLIIEGTQRNEVVHKLEDISDSFKYSYLQQKQVYPSRIYDATNPYLVLTSTILEDNRSSMFPLHIKLLLFTGYMKLDLTSYHDHINILKSGIQKLLS